MKIAEIKEKETPAIAAELKQAHRHLFDLRAQAVTEKLENPSLLRKTRRQIAQMKTVLRQRELEPVEKAAKEKKAAAAATALAERKAAVEKNRQAKAARKAKYPAKAR
jgi:large subunit ribosomal protein L29